MSEADYLVIWREQNRVNAAGFSTKFVESVTVGTPVITTDTGELRKYIIEYALGYVVTKKADIIDTTVLKKSPQLNDKVGMFCVWSYDRIIEEWINTVQV